MANIAAANLVASWWSLPIAVVAVVVVTNDGVDTCDYGIAHGMDKKFQCGSHIGLRVIGVLCFASHERAAYRELGVFPEKTKMLLLLKPDVDHDGLVMVMECPLFSRAHTAWLGTRWSAPW